MNDNSNNRNLNIVFALFALIMIGWVVITTPININRTCNFETKAFTRDAALITVKWSAIYKAPLIIPKEIKLDAEDKIEIYGSARIHTFIRFNGAKYFSETDIKEMQKEFDETDVIKGLIRLFDNKIDNVKSIKLDSVKIEELLKQRLDSLKNVMMTKLY
jgi:hypothetical protein